MNRLQEKNIPDGTVHVKILKRQEDEKHKDLKANKQINEAGD